MADLRTDPPIAAGEREMLGAWLDYHRATLLVKCDGLHLQVHRSLGFATV